jgi:hypothetical protein
MTSKFYAFLNVVIQYTKTLDNNIKNILYFTDSTASQYNSRRNVSNLVTHKKDFGFEKFCLLGYNAMYSTGCQLRFQRNISSASPGLKRKPSTLCLLPASCCFFQLTFPTAQYYIPDDRRLHNHCCENLQFCDFRIVAELHIFAISDNIDPCDALGGKKEDKEQVFNDFMTNKYQFPKPSKDFQRKTFME